MLAHKLSANVDLNVCLNVIHVGYLKCILSGSGSAQAVGSYAKFSKCQHVGGFKLGKSSLASDVYVGSDPELTLCGYIINGSVSVVNVVGLNKNLCCVTLGNSLAAVAVKTGLKCIVTYNNSLLVSTRVSNRMLVLGSLNKTCYREVSNTAGTCTRIVESDLRIAACHSIICGHCRKRLGAKVLNRLVILKVIIVYVVSSVKGIYDNVKSVFSANLKSEITVNGDKLVICCISESYFSVSEKTEELVESVTLYKPSNQRPSVAFLAVVFGKSGNINQIEVDRELTLLYIVPYARYILEINSSCSCRSRCKTATVASFLITAVNTYAGTSHAGVRNVGIRARNNLAATVALLGYNNCAVSSVRKGIVSLVILPRTGVKMGGIFVGNFHLDVIYVNITVSIKETNTVLPSAFSAHGVLCLPKLCIADIYVNGSLVVCALGNVKLNDKGLVESVGKSVARTVHIHHFGSDTSTGLTVAPVISGVCSVSSIRSKGVACVLCRKRCNAAFGIYVTLVVHIVALNRLIAKLYVIGFNTRNGSRTVILVCGNICRGHLKEPSSVYADGRSTSVICGKVCFSSVGGHTDITDLSRSTVCGKLHRN